MRGVSHKKKIFWDVREKERLSETCEWETRGWKTCEDMRWLNERVCNLALCYENTLIDGYINDCLTSFLIDISKHIFHINSF